MPRELRQQFADDQHPAGRRILARTTGERDPAKAYEIAKPILDGWKAQFAALRRGGKTATQVKAEQLAQKYARAKKLDQDEAGYLRLIDIFDFAARELVGLSARAWHERLVAAELDPVAALISLPGGKAAIGQVEAITSTRTLFLSKIADFQTAIAKGLDAKTAYEYGLDVNHFAAMFADLTVEAFGRQHVQDFINDRMVAQGKARATVVKQISAIRSYWQHLCGLDESRRERRPFVDLIWPRRRSCGLGRATPTSDSVRTTTGRISRRTSYRACGKPRTRRKIMISGMSLPSPPLRGADARQSRLCIGRQSFSTPPFRTLYSTTTKPRLVAAGFRSIRRSWCCYAHGVTIARLTATCSGEVTTRSGTSAVRAWHRRSVKY